MSDKMREALELIVGRLAEHPEYAELIEEQEEEIGGDTAEFSYLVRVGRDALAEQPAQDWSTGQVDADGEPLVTITRAEYDRLKQPAQGEAVAVATTRREFHEYENSEKIDRDGWLTTDFVWLSRPKSAGTVNLYTAPPAPSVPDEMWAGPPHTVDYVNGWNACREAVLAAAPEVKP